MGHYWSEMVSTAPPRHFDVIVAGGARHRVDVLDDGCGGEQWIATAPGFTARSRDPRVCVRKVAAWHGWDVIDMEEVQ